MRNRTLVLQLVASLSFLAPVAFALDPADEPQTCVVRRWDTEDGMPSSPSRHIVQTRDDYLWIGTEHGIVRFDGLAFTTFEPPEVLDAPPYPLTALLEDREGTLWAGTSSALHAYRNGRFRRYDAKDGLIGNGASALCLGPDGVLWIGNNLGITRLVGGAFVKDIDTTGINTVGVRHMWCDRRGDVWVSGGVILLRCTGKTVKAFGTADGLPSLGIEFVDADADGNVVVSTQSGLFRLEGDRFVKLPYAFANQHINTTHVDRDGNLWVGSETGLERVSHGKVARHLLPNGKSVGSVDAIFEDREGTLWLVGSGGLFRLNNRRATTWAEEKGVLGTVTLAIKQTRDGSLWISSWGGGVVRLLNGHATEYRAGAPFSNDNVTCIYEAPDGSMWFGNRGSAVDHLENGRVTTYVYPPGVPTSRPVNAILLDDNGDLLLGIVSRGVFRLRHGVIEPVPEAPDLVKQSIAFLHRLRDGRVLLGTSVGLFRRELDKSWHRVEAIGGTPVYGVVEDGNGVLWIGTKGKGIVRLNGSDVRVYGTHEGLSSDQLSSIIDDGMGSIWITHSGGIARVPRSEFDAFDRGEISRLSPVNFGRADGLVSASVANGGAPVAERAADGTLLFATLNGAAVISPANVRTNAKPPNVVIESVTLDGRTKRIADEGTLTVPTGVNRLEIRYTALSLIVPERQRFKYQLAGSDPAWIDADRSRIASYTHLAPGSYEFKVIACNNDGVWTTTPATLRMVVTPRFYQTPWFKLLAATLVLASAGGVVGARIRRLKQRQAALARSNAELDQRVRERTAELEQRESLFRLIFEHAPVGVSWSRADLGSAWHFNSAFCRILGLDSPISHDPDLLVRLAHPDDVAQHHRSEAAIAAGTSDVYAIEQRFIRPNGEQVHALLAAAVVRDRQGAAVQHIRIAEDISALKRTQAELEAAHKRLVDAARLAGMAEIATSVLHNVGNVLNSVNVSSSLIGDGLRGLRTDGLDKINGLLRENAADLARFFREDPKARHVAPYLATLGSHLQIERERLIHETETLRKSVEHIKEIVAHQQSLAHHRVFLEPVAPADLVEDALKMTSVALDRHGIEVIREYGDVPLIVADRHKALQIMTNLIQNAKQATDNREPGNRRLCIRLGAGPDHVRIEIEDNGVGIPAENLARIFELGFTTRPQGHGFGLHSSANAAKEMNGSLIAESDGLDRGARFILTLPIAQPAGAKPDRPQFAAVVAPNETLER